MRKRKKHTPTTTVKQGTLDRRFVLYFLYLTLFLTGAVVLVMEILGTRVLAPFYGSTVFVWSSLISVALGFLSLGYYFGGKAADRKAPIETLYWFILFAGISLILIPHVDSLVLVATDFLGIKFGPLASAAILFSVPFFFLGTVTPLILKIRIHTLHHVGVTAGNIFAIATVGSLVGALSAGFFFIPLIPTSIVFFILGFILVALWFGWNILKKGKSALAIFGLLSAITILILPSYNLALQDNVKILYKKTGFFGTIKVYKAFSDIICLMIDTSSQSCWNFGENKSAWAYTRYVRALENYYPKEEWPLDVLVLGLGGGSIIKEWAPQGHNIDVIEINPTVIELAKQYVGLPGPNDGVHYILGDARYYVRHTDKKYDIIMVDTIVGDDIAFHLSTEEFYKEVRSILNPGGFFAVNAKGRLLTQKLQPIVYKTLNQVFPYVNVTARNKDVLSTVVFFASDRPMNYKAFKQQIPELLGPEIWNGTFNLAKLPIVTDDYNPTHLLDLETKPEGRKDTQGTFGNGIYLYEPDA